MTWKIKLRLATIFESLKINNTKNLYHKFVVSRMIYDVETSKFPTCEVLVKPFHSQGILGSSSLSFGEQRMNKITQIRTETRITSSFFNFFFLIHIAFVCHFSPTECQRKTQTRKRNQRTLRTRPIVLCNVYRLAIPNGDGNHRSWPKCFARPCPSTLVAPTVASTAATYNLGRVSAFRSTWRQSSWFRPTPRYKYDRDYQRTRM